MMWKKMAACMCTVAMVTVGSGTAQMVYAEAAEANKDMSGEITFSFWGTPEEVEVQEMITEAFNKEYPNIKVNLDHVSGAGDFNTTILTRISGGTAPDVFYMGEVMVPIYSDKGVVEDLLPYAEKDGIDLSDYWEGVLSPAGYNDGHLWAFAKDCTPYMIYYNKDKFDEAGVDYPDSSWDFEKFRETCIAMTKTDDSGKIIQYGFSPENGWPAWFNIVYKNGGRIMDEEGKRLVSDPNTAEALQFYMDLANVDHCATNPDDMASMGGGEVDAFKSGLTSMIVGGRFMTYFLKDFDGNYGFTTFPVNKSEEAPLNFVSLGMAKDSKNKEAAWEFIKFYCGKTGQEINSATGMGMPVMKSVTESGVWMLEGETQEQLDVILKQFKNTKDHPFHSEWMKLIDDIFARNMTEAARGKITAQEALDKIVEEGNTYLEEIGK